MTITEFSLNYLPLYPTISYRVGRQVCENFQEHPQSILPTDSITPILQQLTQMLGTVLVKTAASTGANPPESPGWFYVPNVPPTLDGQMRRSYVMWQEIVAPLMCWNLSLEIGKRDQTSYEGKFGL